MNGEIISYLELCVREKAHLQHGMNWRIQSTHSVFLMSTRKGSPTMTELKMKAVLLFTKDMMHRRTPHLKTQRLWTNLEDCLAEN